MQRELEVGWSVLRLTKVEVDPASNLLKNRFRLLAQSLSCM